MDYKAHQAPLSMGFSRQEHWSGLPFPSLGDLPDPGSNQPNTKMGQRPKWTFVQRRHRDGHKAHEVVLRMTVREVSTKTATRYLLTALRMAIFQKIYKDKVLPRVGRKSAPTLWVGM